MSAPERLDHFMARANAAYYATHDPFADFTTSPEISQVFGEIIGLWSAVTWQSLGCPHPVVLAEAGPGRGTLMADALRAVGRAMPAFRAAARVHLIETSPRLRAAQKERVRDAVWHDQFDTIPDGPMILLANEFLDALPIRQFVRRGAGWAERYVLDGAFQEQPVMFGPSSVVDGSASRNGLPMLKDAPDCPNGTILEWDESAEALVRALARRMMRSPGTALLLDYGPEHCGPGDSLQALTAGAPTHPLGPAGTADLTAHVDFARIAHVARAAGAAVAGPVPQGLFLARLGLFQRANQLARGQQPRQAMAIMDAARRLAEPDRMGRLFKVLAVTSPALGTPAGFV